MSFLTNLLQFLLFVIPLTGFSHEKWKKDKLQELNNQGYYIVIGCNIYDVYGKVKRGYPGNDCIFHDDGSYLSYSLADQVLTRYSKNLKKEWSLKLHVHHGMNLTSNGDYLINSSVVENYQGNKKLRHDVILLVSQDGKINHKFSFRKFFEDYVKKKPWLNPYKTHWDPNLDFDHEYSHLAASYELLKPLKIDSKIVCEKGNFILTLNTIGKGAYILDADLSKIVGQINLSDDIFHDVQQFSNTKVIFFENSKGESKKPNASQAFVSIYDTIEKKIERRIDAHFSAFFGGGVQVIEDDLFMISDTSLKIQQAETINKMSFEERIRAHINGRSRLSFYSFAKGLVHEVIMDFQFNLGKMKKLKKFLDNNSGL
jgi:hypothetical protein